MKVLFTQNAKDKLDEIFQYFKDKSLTKTGRQIRAKILAKALSLKDFPFIGQEDELLKTLGKNHRYLVEGNYKIIYRVELDTVFVLNIFDTRQDPQKLKE